MSATIIGRVKQAPRRERAGTGIAEATFEVQENRSWRHPWTGERSRIRSRIGVKCRGPSILVSLFEERQKHAPHNVLRARARVKRLPHGFRIVENAFQIGSHRVEIQAFPSTLAR